GGRGGGGCRYHRRCVRISFGNVEAVEAEFRKLVMVVGIPATGWNEAKDHGVLGARRIVGNVRLQGPAGGKILGTAIPTDVGRIGTDLHPDKLEVVFVTPQRIVAGFLVVYP